MGWVRRGWRKLLCQQVSLHEKYEAELLALAEQHRAELVAMMQRHRFEVSGRVARHEADQVALWSTDSQQRAGA